MRFSLLHRRRRGFLLLEVLMGIAILGAFLGGVGLTLLLGQESTIMAGDRIRAVHLSQRALEAGRSVRDAAFDGVLTGERGVDIDASGRWALTAEPVTDAKGFRTALTIVPLGDGHLGLRARTTWKRGYNRSGSVLIATEITDWRAPAALGNWQDVSIQGSVLFEDPTQVPLFTRVATAGRYLFAAGEADEGGAGLYVFDLASLASPQRVAAGLALGVTAYDVAVRGDRLYVLTADDTAEIQVYDIADPSTLSVADRVATANLPGEGRGRSLVLYGDTLIVGTINDPTEEDGMHELYFFNAALADIGSLDLPDAGDIVAIALSGTSAMLATTDVNAEIRAADVRASSLQFPPDEAFNAAGDVPGRSIAALAGIALLGRAGTQALARFDLGSAQGFVPATPSYLDVGGSANGVAIDPSGCVAFVAVDALAQDKEVQVVRIGSATMEPLGWAHADTGGGRDVLYDAERDRAYLLTERALHVLRPGLGSLTCP